VILFADGNYIWLLGRNRTSWNHVFKNIRSYDLSLNKLGPPNCMAILAVNAKLSFDYKKKKAPVW